MSLARDLAWHNLDLAYQSSISHQLARYALSLNYESLPQEVVHEAKRSVLDALSCAIGAYEAPGLPICEATALEFGGPEEATVFPSGRRTSVLNAILINCFLVRFLDLNESGGGGHNSDAIPPILAVCEREKGSGKDFLTSVVTSYELGFRFRDAAASSKHKGWLVDIRGGLSMPPALGKLMGLNEDQIANAMGICASHSLPLEILDAHREENTMAKNLRFGFVCYHAVLSCGLAKRGFTGPVRVVEGDGGMREVLFHNDFDLDRLTDFSGWRIFKTRRKYLPANYVTQGHVASTIALVKENDLKPEDIAQVRLRVGLREVLHAASCSAKKYPRNAESADHSAYYCTAIAIKERALGPEQYRPEKFSDPVVLDLIEKITIEADPSLPERSYASTSEIITRDGRRFKKHIDVPHGALEDPLTDAEIEDRFWRMGPSYMPDKQIKELIDTVWNLEKVDDISQLAKLMTAVHGKGRSKKMKK